MSHCQQTLKNTYCILRTCVGHSVLYVEYRRDEIKFLASRVYNSVAAIKIHEHGQSLETCSNHTQMRTHLYKELVKYVRRGEGYH